MKQRTARRHRWTRSIAASACALIVGVASAAHAVIIDSGDGAGNIDPPPDFPWWHHVDQRLGGTSIIYLGNGWVLTARHVGMGSLLYGGTRYEPDPDTAVTFGDPDSPTDLIAFRLARGKPWPALRLMEFAATTPVPGEEVLMIGNGRNRGRRLRDERQGANSPLGWGWSAGSKKRWGTNRVAAPYQVIDHGDTSTLAFSTRFDSLFMAGATPHEAQAATGDSGGAVFKRRDANDPDSEWVLAGVIFTVNHPNGGPLETALYGDYTHAADLSVLRDELIEAVRPQCANERDDDGDGLTDHPTGADCESAHDDEEADGSSQPAAPDPFWLQGVTIAAASAALIYAVTRGSRTRR